jgi:hypothetical protein
VRATAGRRYQGRWRFRECAASDARGVGATCGGKRAGCRRWTAGRRYQGRRRFRECAASVARGVGATCGRKRAGCRRWTAGRRYQGRRRFRECAASIARGVGAICGRPSGLYRRCFPANSRESPLSVAHIRAESLVEHGQRAHSKHEQGDRQCFPSRQTSQP